MRIEGEWWPHSPRLRSASLNPCLFGHAYACSYSILSVDLILQTSEIVFPSLSSPAAAAAAAAQRHSHFHRCIQQSTGPFLSLIASPPSLLHFSLIQPLMLDLQHPPPSLLLPPLSLSLSVLGVTSIAIAGTGWILVHVSRGNRCCSCLLL